MRWPAWMRLPTRWGSDMGGPDDRNGIVWLEDGHEAAFEPATPPRPWLEESLEWGAKSDDSPPEPAGDGPAELVWL